MKFNLPLIPAIQDSDHILIIGAGGGFDFLGGYPIQYQIENDYPNKTVYLEDNAKKVGRSGVKPVISFLNELVDRLGITSVLVVDGGVDSLMRGDEKGGGTLLEDSVTLAAVAQVKVRHKTLVCTGFGTESEEGLCHYLALENIADLAKEGAFLGTCSLTPQMEAFEFYKVQADHYFKEYGRQSHIHGRIIPAILGEFEEQFLYPEIDARVAIASANPAFVNPLMGIFWFFDLMKVYDRNLFAKELLPTTTSTDALMVYRANLDRLMANARPNISIPL